MPLKDQERGALKSFRQISKCASLMSFNAPQGLHETVANSNDLIWFEKNKISLNCTLSKMIQ